ncbi:MAG: hypothetical protein QOE46_1804 [Acidobacteriota bacterium]|jgi:hypothetical protein|nr:hypothetical protein [Acidobacteriota bacterium]
MRNKLYNRAATVMTLLLLLAPSVGRAGAQQSNPPPFNFRSGQSMYIVAYTRSLLPVTTDVEQGSAVTYRDYFDFQIDAERKVRTEIEEWKFFRVADKLSEADFVFLVSIHDSTMEGLAVPFDAYNRHFKEKFDLDALREAAYGRYLAGPLKLPTLSRLSDRLIKQFREKLATGRAAAR